MTFAVAITLAGPPRGKGRGRAVSTSHGARVYTDAKTRTYEAQLRYAAQQVMGDRPPTDEPVRVVMTAGFAVPASWAKRKRADALAGRLWPTMRPDADNLAKCCDALNGVVWGDDKQVVSALILKVYREQPSLHIEVSALSDGRAP